MSTWSRGTLGGAATLSPTSGFDCRPVRATLSRIGAAAPEVIELFDYLEDTPMWMKDAAGHYDGTIVGATWAASPLSAAE